LDDPPLLTVAFGACPFCGPEGKFASPRRAGSGSAGPSVGPAARVAARFELGTARPVALPPRADRFTDRDVVPTLF
jgi:hypothetical protein